MRILVAEDEENISTLYRIALEGRGHEVTVTKDGKACVDEYHRRIRGKGAQDRMAAPPFDVTILDYRMPVMDGLDTAKEILKMRAKQRIIFASAFVKETLLESIKTLDQIVELLQKPFEIDVLIDTVEDKTIYEQLEKLNVNISHLKDWALTHEQVRDLLDGLLKLRKPDFELKTSVASESSERGYAPTSHSAG